MKSAGDTLNCILKIVNINADIISGPSRRLTPGAPLFSLFKIQFKMDSVIFRP